MKRRPMLIAIPRPRIVGAGIFCCLLFFLNITPVFALSYDQPESVAPIKSNMMRPVARVQIGYHSFTGTSMNDSYDPVVVGTIGGIAWGEKFGLGVEFSFSSGEGTPALRTSNWDVSDSWVKMTAHMLGFNALYRFANSSGDDLFEPYVMAGPALWIGSERISATASRMPVGIYESFQAELLALAFSFGGNAGVGTTIHIKDRLRALFEVRWIVSTSGSTGDLATEEEQADFDSSLYEAVERPGFSFTGWRIDLGVQW
jgi:hypothetical protein